MELQPKPHTLDFSFAKRHQLFYNQAHNVLYHTKEMPTFALAGAIAWIDQPFDMTCLPQAQFEQQLNDYYESLEQDLMTSINEGDIDQVLDELPDSEDLLESQESAPIIKLLNSLLSQAIKMNASDIHFEIFKDSFIVRFRIDGVLHEVHRLGRNLSILLISRIKVMAKLDIAEKKVPQDGRINLKIAGREIDVRVSTLPSNHGERAVLRILDKKNARLELQHLGARPNVLKLIEQMISKPHGIILVTGPTGSGKTTTLYAALNELNDHERNILTVEDPIEYDLPGIGQTAVNPKVGMTFAQGLRAILRQDPDVIMVGEIRDKETASIAIEASLTGHLVFSTLHTNHAIGALVRLQDMGVPSFLLASSLIGVIAQRLVRTLCTHCKEAYQPDELEKQTIGVEEDVTLYKAKGCEACNQFGYRGRISIYEIVILDENVRKLIHDNATESVLTDTIRSRYPDIRHDGMARVLSGETSLEEVLRVTQQNGGTS